MATVIRLKRTGRTHAPYYRLVVMDSRDRTRGREVDQIGTYQPCARPEPKTDVDAAKAMAWLSKGAQLSATVRSILSKKGLLAATGTAGILAGHEVRPHSAAPAVVSAPEA